MSIRDDFNKTHLIQDLIDLQKGVFSVAQIFNALPKHVRGDEITRDDVGWIIRKEFAAKRLERTGRGEYVKMTENKA